MERSRRLLAGFFVTAGTMHFVVPRAYEAMMPRSLPRHREAVAVSGIAEIAGGLAVLPPPTRRLARWWLLALLLAVFPANVHMALKGRPGARVGFPARPRRGPRRSRRLAPARR